jgi:dolichol-phosphate mannosyltransferase
MASHSAEGSVTIIVPTLNEAENVAPLVQQIIAAAPQCAEIIIVDDGSSDGTRARVEELAKIAPVRLLARDQPTLGLSGAVIAGARSATSDVLVIMDADLSHPPADISRLAEPVINGRADIVIGSRYVRGGTTPGWPIYRKLMSRVAAGLAYPLTGVHDSMCGFFAIRRTRLLELAPLATGFKIAFEAIVHGGRDLRVLELPIAFRDRARGTSKMNLAVALVFSVRWFAAAGRVFTRKRAGVSDSTAPARAR